MPITPSATSCRIRAVATSSCTAFTLDPPTGANVTVTAYAHRLPSTPVLIVLVVALLGAVIAFDARVVPDSSGTLVLATGVAARQRARAVDE
jgi:hypothetical protein